LHGYSMQEHMALLAEGACRPSLVYKHDPPAEGHRNLDAIPIFHTISALVGFRSERLTPLQFGRLTPI